YLQICKNSGTSDRPEQDERDQEPGPCGIIRKEEGLEEPGYQGRPDKEPAFPALDQVLPVHRDSADPDKGRKRRCDGRDIVGVPECGCKTEEEESGQEPEQHRDEGEPPLACDPDLLKPFEREGRRSSHPSEKPDQGKGEEPGELACKLLPEEPGDARRSLAIQHAAGCTGPGRLVPVRTSRYSRAVSSRPICGVRTGSPRVASRLLPILPDRS